MRRPTRTPQDPIATRVGADAPCPEGKGHRFETWEQAEDHLRAVKAARRAGQVGNGNTEHSVYFCSLCAGHHLTHKARKAPRRGNRARQPGRR